MAGEYTRQSSYADGDVITAAHTNDEFNQLLAAFVASTGHTHDGTAGEGGPVSVLRDADAANKVVIDSTNNHLEFYVQVSSSAVQQLRIQDGAIVPIADDDIDLGTSGLEFKDLHLDGTANIDSLVADTADINGGTADNIVIGGSTAAAITGTTLVANTSLNIAGDGATVTGIKDEDDMSSNSDTKLATQQSIKAYVDATVTAQDLDFQADSGGALNIDLDSETLTLTGGTGIDTSGSGNAVTFAIDSTVATLAGSQSLTNKTIDVDNNTVSNIEVDNLKSGVLDTDLSSVSGSDDTLASAKSIKTYVDAQVTAQDLDVTTDSGTIDIDLDSEALTIAGGEGIDTSASGTTITIEGEDASTSNKGIASFSSDNFAVSSGAVTIKDGGVVTDEIADANVTLAKIANQAANTVLVRDANSSGVLSAKALATTQILIGDGTGFTAAALSGDVTMTNAGVVTIAAGAVENSMLADDAVGADELAANAVVNASIASGAAIADTKLATISTANKISLTALDIDGGTDIGEAVADADLFIVDNGAGGTNRKVTASALKTYAGGSGASKGFATAMAIAL